MLFWTALQAFRAVDKALRQSIDRMVFVRLFFGIAMVMLCISFLSWWLLATLTLLLPIALLLAYVSYRDNLYLHQAVRRTFFLLKGAYWRTVGMAILLLVLGLTLFSIINSAVAQLFFQMINWLVYAEQAVLDEWSLRVNTFLLVAIANFIWLLLFFGSALLYYTLREINEATALRKRVSTIGQSRRIRGLERE